MDNKESVIATVEKGLDDLDESFIRDSLTSTGAVKTAVALVDSSETQGQLLSLEASTAGGKAVEKKSSRRGTPGRLRRPDFEFYNSSLPLAFAYQPAKSVQIQCFEFINR